MTHENQRFQFFKSMAAPCADENLTFAQKIQNARAEFWLNMNIAMQEHRNNLAIFKRGPSTLPEQAKEYTPLSETSHSFCPLPGPLGPFREMRRTARDTVRGNYQRPAKNSSLERIW